MRSRIGERPDFYRGSAASLILHGGPPDEAAVAAFLESMRGYGIEVRGLYGTDAVAALAVRHGIAYLGEPVRPQPAPVSSIDRRRTVPAAPPPPLTDAARSLDADFAGARADLAARRSRRDRAGLARLRPAGGAPCRRPGRRRRDPLLPRHAARRAVPYSRWGTSSSSAT